ncbi:MAG: preprotein translocase subunit TatB [Betaproteobacteria bacterium RIFCSPLOWO2_12_FULL_62_13]|nr:MAG: preprotein translocase subunit TatB [Betaproteobacteria bacterium RIFCSPLOWO2_12_FULL_62_13]
MKFEKRNEGEFVLNVTGYVCPHPQLYTKKALEKMKEGEVLELVFDNPSSAESVAAMLDMSGDEILAQNNNGVRYVWKIRKATRN